MPSLPFQPAVPSLPFQPAVPAVPFQPGIPFLPAVPFQPFQPFIGGPGGRGFLSAEDVAALERMILGSGRPPF